MTRLGNTPRIDSPSALDRPWGGGVTESGRLCVAMQLRGTRLSCSSRSGYPVPTEDPVRTDLIDDLADHDQCARHQCARRPWSPERPAVWDGSGSQWPGPHRLVF